MAWDFDGVDQYADFTLSAANQASDAGPFWMAALVHLDSTADGTFINFLDSGNVAHQYMDVFGTWDYGTGVLGRAGPTATTGSWRIVIMTKDAGGTFKPEYTVMDVGGGSPVSGVTASTLTDGTAPGAGGKIRVARYGTSATEYVNGRIAALATGIAYLSQAQREAMGTWAAWLAASGVSWAVEFTALTTRSDATGSGGNEIARFGTASITLAADPPGFFPAGGVTVQDTSSGSGTAGGADGLSLGDAGSGGSGTSGSGDGRALGAGSDGAGTGAGADGRALGSGSDGAGTGGQLDGRALGAGSDGLGVGGSFDGLAVGDLSGGAATSGSSDTITSGGVTVADSSDGAGTGGSGDGRALGAGSGGAGSAASPDGVAVADTSGGSGSSGSVDGLALGSGPGGAGTGGSAGGVALGDAAGGSGTGGSPDGRALSAGSDGAGTGSSGDTVAGGPVTIGDVSGGAGTGGSPDTADSSQVVHDKMVMPIVLKARDCLVVEVGKVANPPKHVQVRPGATFTAMADQVGDECCEGIAWVRPGTQTPTASHWPDPIDNVDAVDGGQPVWWAIQVELGIERCIPSVSNVEGERGQAPTAAQWLQATQDHLDDAAALRRAVCCLMAIYGNDGVLMSAITPLQNEGNCGGQTVVVTVRAPACDCIDAG